MLTLHVSTRATFAVIAIGTLLLVATARANDGGIAFGGSPGLLEGHQSVSMANEVVRMTVGDENATVDCRFVFKNNGPACVARTYYILHTGASWHGDIGRTEVVVTLNRRRMTAPVNPVALSRVPKRNPYDWSLSNWRPGTVVYQGPCVPTISGKTLRFVRSRW